jgi:hypothetical protein
MFQTVKRDIKNIKSERKKAKRKRELNHAEELRR